MENTILLIDGSSFIFRAFYAVKNLTAPNGTPTNAIYGVINMLKQMQKKYTTPYWVCVFDAKGKTFRDDIYPEYKATRRETPEELKQQIPYIHEIIADLGIPVIVQEGVEADDVIATIAKHYSTKNYKILVATGDKDFAQIVNENIKLINTMTNEELDIDGVINKFGVLPEQIIDYLSLIGDTVDNVPGVTKCGPKTAVKWLQEFKSIDGLIANQNKLSGIVGENFRQAVNWLPTAQQLITIDCNVNIDKTDITQLDNLRIKDENTNKLVQIFKELNFRTWLKEAEIKLNNTEYKTYELSTTGNLQNQELFDNLNNTSQINEKQLNTVKSIEELSILVDKIVKHNLITATHIINDDYTDSLSPIVAVVIELENENYLIKLQNSSSSNELLLDSSDHNDDWIRILKPYWESKSPKIVANSKFFYYQLANINVIANGIIGDLAIASYIQSSNNNHEITRIIARTLNIAIKNPDEIFGKGSKKIKFSTLPEHSQIEYINSINNTLAAHNIITARISPEELSLYLDTELPLAKILYTLEYHGIKIDIGRLRELSATMHTQLKTIEDKVQQKSGIAFNLNSPKQLQDVLFNQLKLPTDGIKKIASGYSTDEDTLNNLSEQGFEIADLLLENRYLNKLLNTYVDRLPEYADINGLVHTSLEQTIVTSGRLSSKDPNLQNIPVRSEYGQAIRECFIATDDHVLVCADYSQIELRILAHISQDDNLINAFKSGADIHLATASQIFGKPMNEITKDERRYAKSINFGLIYGKSAFGLAKELKIERAAAKLYIDNYFAQYPKVKQYMDDIKKYAHNHGYVKTIYDRKIYLPNINASNSILRQAEERLALNAPMQGSASDIIKMAMINIDNWLNEKNLSTKMILQVHDELIFNVPQNEVELILTELPRLMSEKTVLAVPLEIDAKSASNWGLAH